VGAVRRRSAPNITFFFKRWRDLGAVTWKASARMLLAAGTSSASHLDLAPISHRTSALGQWATALWSRASKDSLRRRRALQQTPEKGAQLGTGKPFGESGRGHLVPLFFSK